ncbi:MAG TPA: class I tRNA ligase family protein, partial [Chthoniobacterales bacterium]|nr:class I tRNA ligase family protein [Chthoniobacterales bacterium]
REEENYYFKLSQHKDWLIKLLKERPHLIVPKFRHTELENAVHKISGDLCISRPKARLDWGIELPFDKDFVTYVWFDALTNYISFAGYDPSLSTFNSQPSTFLEKWPALQIIGKDILIPAHGIYWLIMLHAIGFPDDAMPQLLAHGWLNIGGAKMSKSLGNIVDPNLLADKYGAEAVRYYLMSDIATGKDADFSEERLIDRYNADLSNAVGNLLNRSLNMVHRYSPNFSNRQINEDVISEESWPEFVWRNETRTQFISRMDCQSCSQALREIHVFATSCDMFIDSVKPWLMARDARKFECLSAVLYQLIESLRIIAILISPVLPKAAHGIFDQLNWKMELSGKDERFALKDAEWGGLSDGHVVGKPVPLFPRIEGRGD